jgi:hypothetical protein
MSAAAATAAGRARAYSSHKDDSNDATAAAGTGGTGTAEPGTGTGTGTGTGAGRPRAFSYKGIGLPSDPQSASGLPPAGAAATAAAGSGGRGGREGDAANAIAEEKGEHYYDRTNDGNNVGSDTDTDTNPANNMKPAQTQGQGQGQIPMSKDLNKLRLDWGVEWVLRIFEAYALLQRMATILSWNLEINHFFVSMFGNTLAFSKLPLQEILMTQKDIMGKFLVVSTELFRYTCQLNADQQYKWHKNLQMTEQQLNMVKHHTEKVLGLINKIGKCECACICMYPLFSANKKFVSLLPISVVILYDHRPCYSVPPRLPDFT